MHNNRQDKTLYIYNNYAKQNYTNTISKCFNNNYNN